MAIQTVVSDKTIHVGDTVKVYYQVIEKEKVAGRTKRSVKEKTRKRLQPFEGLVIAIKGAEENQSFTVRRISKSGIGVERIFPVLSPWIKKIEVKSQGKVRRSKLYYLREKLGKAAIKLKAKKTDLKKRQSSKTKEVGKTKISKTKEGDKKDVKEKKTKKSIRSKEK